VPVILNKTVNTITSVSFCIEHSCLQAGRITLWERSHTRLSCRKTITFGSSGAQPIILINETVTYHFPVVKTPYPPPGCQETSRRRATRPTNHHQGKERLQGVGQSCKGPVTTKWLPTRGTTSVLGTANDRTTGRATEDRRGTTAATKIDHRQQLGVGERTPLPHRPNTASRSYDAAELCRRRRDATDVQHS
jgi:hypothetical protein